MATIAVDFDDTITSPKLLELVKLAHRWCRANDVKMICVTCRRETEVNVDFINAFFDQHGIQMEIYFTNLGSKLRRMDLLGIKVDWWLDDDPKSLVSGYV